MQISATIIEKSIFHHNMVKYRFLNNGGTNLHIKAILAKILSWPILHITAHIRCPDPCLQGQRSSKDHP